VFATTQLKQAKNAVFMIALDQNYRGIIAQSPDAQFGHVHVSYCHGDLFLWNLLLAGGR